MQLKDIFDMYVKYGNYKKKIFFAWKTCTFRISRKYKDIDLQGIYSDRKKFSFFEKKASVLNCFICYRIKKPEESKEVKEILTKIYPKHKFTENNKEDVVFSFKSIIKRS